MKAFNIIFYFLFFIFFVNCSSIKKEPIVDYKIKTDNEKYYDFESIQTQQTVVIIDKKEVPLATFKEFMQQDKIKNFNVIKDTIEIRKLNYPTEKVKAIIVASKK